jgi:hypothetical protein
MFSYVAIAKTLTHTSVYNRGLRVYLDGFVGKSSQLILPNWRQYDVLDNNPEQFCVKIPLIHTLIKQDQLSRASEVLKQAASCECQYFFEEGICKHIVGVCASLDKEFGFDNSQSLNRQKALEKDVFDSLFEAEKVKNHRTWVDLITRYVRQDVQNSYQLDSLSREVAENGEFHKEFTGWLKQFVGDILGDYTKEKRLVKLMLETILVGKEFWWDFWKEYFAEVDERNQRELFFGLWKIHLAKADSTFSSKILSFVSNLSDTEKEDLVERLKFTFKEHAGNLVIAFCFETKYIQWLELHLSELDPNSIIQLCLFVPEKREEYEYYIAKQLAIWTDFLQSGKYDEIRGVFESWRKQLGTSQVYDEALLYLKTTHPKKKSLWKGL